MATANKTTAKPRASRARAKPEPKEELPVTNEETDGNQPGNPGEPVDPPADPPVDPDGDDKEDPNDDAPINPGLVRFIKNNGSTCISVHDRRFRAHLHPNKTSSVEEVPQDVIERLLAQYEYLEAVAE